jgi:hypothetical protein
MTRHGTSSLADHVVEVSVWSSVDFPPFDRDHTEHAFDRGNR